MKKRFWSFIEFWSFVDWGGILCFIIGLVIGAGTTYGFMDCSKIHTEKTAQAEIMRNANDLGEIGTIIGPQPFPE